MKGSFFDRVIVRPHTRCWIWVGAHFTNGYGEINIKRKPTRAHRYSYERFVGPIPANMNVLHRCDVRSCVNPDHLFVGTQRENMVDCFAKGRHPLPRMLKKGEANPRAKLTESDVREILASDDKQAPLAKRFGVSQSKISQIKRRVAWAHLGDN